MKKILISLILFPATLMAAEVGKTYPNHSFDGDMTNSASIQRGAKYFVNYCQGCHSLDYQRYNRLAKDTGLDEEITKKNLIFTGVKFSETMGSAIPKDQSANWFGKAPPDLSLTARSKRPDFIYNYLLGFYLDSSKLTGSNNSVFPSVAMPNILSVLEGDKLPTYDSKETCTESEGNKICHETKEINGFDIVRKGQMSKSEFEEVVYDLTNFLYYVSDPSQLKRHKIGPWVIGFLLLMTLIFYLLKKEFWKDIH